MTEKLKILAIEDDRACAILLEAKLKNRFTLEFAHSKADGIAALKRTRFDVIFLDLGMHDATRETIFQEIQPLSGSAAIIILTGHADPRLRDLHHLKQADGFMVKGIEDSTEDVLWVVQQAIQNRKKH